ncbi:hypothetical protein ScPMuIL_014192 [Solemya velum]
MHVECADHGDFIDVDINTLDLDSSDLSRIVVQPKRCRDTLDERLTETIHRFWKRLSIFSGLCSAGALVRSPRWNFVLWTCIILVLHVVVYFIGDSMTFKPSHIRTYPLLFRDQEGETLYYHVIMEGTLMSAFSQEHGIRNKTANLNDFSR